MSVPKSFIRYMKIMREYYKSGATRPNPLPMDFNFEEIDACSYDFTASATDEKNEQSTGKKTKQTTVNTKPNQQKKIMPTKITTITLFEQNHALNIMAYQPSREQNVLLLLSDRINNVFSKLMSPFNKVSQ